MTEQKSEAIAIDDLELDPRCQVRVELSQEAVDHYAELLKDDVKFPPVEAFKVGAKLVLVDGWHRIAAAKKVDHGFIRCVVVGSGDMDEAAGVALSKNHDHGVQRSRKDKNRAVMMALDLGWGDDGDSNRAIAKKLAVSDPFVGKIRKEWEAERQADSPGAGANVSTPPTTTSPQEATGDVSDDGETQGDETSPAPPLEAAQALAEIADIASQLHKAAKAFHGTAKKAHAGVTGLAGDDLSDLVEVAADVSKDAKAAIASAKVLDEAVAAVLRDEESQLRQNQHGELRHD